ncbi:hypothetical protein Tco_1483264 [Tanacetum coccineum]
MYHYVPVDMAYWDDLIRRIEYDSASIVVEIDLTWSLGFVLVEFGRLPNPLSCSTLLICPICISKVLIDAPWFLMATSVEARISLIKLEFSSCLFADSLMNLLRVSSIDCLRSWRMEASRHKGACLSSKSHPMDRDRKAHPQSLISAIELCATSHCPMKLHGIASVDKGGVRACCLCEWSVWSEGMIHCR